MGSHEIQKQSSRLEVCTIFGSGFLIGIGLTLFHLAGLAVCLAESTAKVVLYASLGSSFALTLLGIVHAKLLGRFEAGRSSFYTVLSLVLIGITFWLLSMSFGAAIAPALVFFTKVLGPFCFLSFMAVLRSRFPGAGNSGLRLAIIAGFPGAQIAGGYLAPSIFNRIGYFHGSGLGIIVILAGGLLLHLFCRMQRADVLEIKPKCKERSHASAKAGRTKNRKSKTWIIVLTVLIALAGSLTSHIYSLTANALDGDPENLTQKLSYVDAISGFFQLMAMTCLGGKLLRWFGEAKYLLMLPVVLFIFGVTFLGLLTLGLSAQHLFWLAASTWVGETVGKSSVHHPAIGVVIEKLLSADDRDRLFSILETLVRPLSKIAAGCVLIFVGNIYLLVLVWLAVVAAWLLAAYWLFRETGKAQSH